MSLDDKEILAQINAYAEKALSDIDPQKTRISFQLDALRPVMEEIAAKTGTSVEDVFIRYMDLASEAALEADRKLQAAIEDETAEGFSAIANRLN